MADPGIPAMRQIARSVARAGALREYVTTFAPARGPARGVLRLLPAAVRRRAERELGRRALPDELHPAAVRTVARAHEAGAVALVRAGAPARVSVAMRSARDRAFDRRAAARVLPGDRAVVAMCDAALATLRAAHERDVRSLIEYPIAHHEYALRLLGEERRRVPDWAGTLQYHELPARSVRRLEAEIELADRILMLSSFQRQTFLEAGVDPAKLVDAPYGVDLEAFRPPGGPPPERQGFRVVFVGQLTQRKGLSYLLDGFARADIPGAELLLVGPPVGVARPWRGHAGVRARGPVPRGELPAVYASADVYVLPSLVEGFPQTALEAMACGLPPIVSENTFGHDVITDGEDGYVIPIRDADAIAERLRMLHADPELRSRMGGAAARRAAQYSWGAHGERVMAAIRGVT